MIFPTGCCRRCAISLVATSSLLPRSSTMAEPLSDALVLFGATGDLAYKKIFPALHAMTRRGHLNFPIIGMVRGGWTIEQLRARARDSIAAHGDLDPETFGRLSARLCCVS